MSKVPQCHGDMRPHPKFSDMVQSDFFGTEEMSHWVCPKCGSGAHYTRDAWRKLQQG